MSNIRIKENPDIFISDDFRELEEGEIIKESDVFYDRDNKEWRDRKGFGDGINYKKSFYTTIRKIIKNEKIPEATISNNKYTFFIDRHENFIYACTEDGGCDFKIKRERFGAQDKSATIKVLKSLVESKTYNEISFNKLKQSISNSLFQLICNKLNIRLEKLNIGEEEKNEIVKTLQESRAFNQDSAMDMKDKKDFCIQLAEEGIIKQEKHRFYVQNH